MVVAASAAALSRVAQDVTRAIVNRDLMPTARFVLDGDIDFGNPAMEKAIAAAAGDGNAEFVEGTRLATALAGDSIATNLFMLGYAFQRGLVPLSLAAIERAIDLNVVAVAESERTFAWGRLAAHDPAGVEAIVRPVSRIEAPRPSDLAALVERRVAFLTDYQDAGYAERYRALVAVVANAEAERAKGCRGLPEAVAGSLFKLMAYKDEYEVARLYTDGTFAKSLQRQFEGTLRLEFHLAPPLLARRDPATGHAVKRTYGGWMRHVFALLRRGKRLPGTRLAPFGWTAERRTERPLVADYVAIIGEITVSLAPENHALALEIARLPERYRGFGHVKARNVVEAKALESDLLALLRSPQRFAAAAD